MGPCQPHRTGRIQTLLTGNSIPDTLLPLIKQYFADFSDKACCFEDLKPYVASLRPEELDGWREFLVEQDGQRDVSAPASLQRAINVFKFQRFSATDDRSEEQEYADATLYLEVYFEALPLGKLSY